MLPLLAAGAVAGAGLAQTGLDYWQSLKDQALTRETNALNYRMWQEGLEYNKPVNQVSRLKDAGLNPALMYGTGQGANVGSPPPRAEAPRQGSIRGIDPGAVTAVQQARLISDQAALVREQTRGQRIDNDVLEGTGSTRRDSATVRAVREGVKAISGSPAMQPAKRLLEDLNRSKSAPKFWEKVRESVTPAVGNPRPYMPKNPSDYYRK